MTKKEKKRIKELATKVGKVFKEFNATVCSKCPISKHSSHPRRKAGCCKNCADQLGYFERSDGTSLAGCFTSTFNYPLPVQFKKLKAKYWLDDEWGFFNPLKRCCQLLRHERSETCLRFFCSAFEKGYKEERKKVCKWTREMSNIRRRNGLLW